MSDRSKFVNNILVLIVIFTVALISGPATTLVISAPPGNGFKNASDCSDQLVGSKLQTTCCWKHTTEIYSPNTSRCQTCENRDGTYSNCTEVFVPRNSDSTIPGNTGGGGVLSNDEGSNESENTNPKNIGGNVLNDGSSNGSSESGSFDPDKVVGGGFNQ